MTHAGKRNVLGVLVDAIDYDTATDIIIRAARQRRALAVTALAVHGVMTGVQNPEHQGRLNTFDLVTPDGQPVRWALNWLHGSQLDDRVYGPELTMRVLQRCAGEGLGVFLYGSTSETLDRLSVSLERKLPSLDIVGTEPSKYRLARPGEAEDIAQQVSDSGAHVVLVGLGCPRQEEFTHAMRPLVNAPLLAVGAAFDYHSGGLKIPPPWVQARGLEWLWRLWLEPRRLWRRYLLLNPAYSIRLLAQGLRLWRPEMPKASDHRTHAFPI